MLRGLSLIGQPKIGPNGERMAPENIEIEERRAHRRLDIRLPLDYSRLGMPRSSSTKTVTRNVSTGGLCFETVADDLSPGDELAFDLGVPPSDSRYPPHATISTVGRVIRTSKIDDEPNDDGVVFTRYSIAAQFEKSLKLAL